MNKEPIKNWSRIDLYRVGNQIRTSAETNIQPNLRWLVCMIDAMERQLRDTKKSLEKIYLVETGRQKKSKEIIAELHKTCSNVNFIGSHKWADEVPPK
jgi:DNA-binding protein H-NS